MYSSRLMYIVTPANVPFLLYTGSNSTQTVWFKANYYKQVGTAAPTYLGSGEWFYNYLRPGQVTTSYWYRHSTGAMDIWTSQRSITIDNNISYFTTYELWWYQNGVFQHKDVIRPLHNGSGAPNATACIWYQWVWV
ncbi:MAG: hypothetical protein M3430_20515 [Acidobacteriota bacterium]|nr:hypothetical protein [Acidobacteriota bacterium]